MGRKSNIWKRGKKQSLKTIFGIGIASVAGIFFGVLPLVVIFYYIFEIVLQGPSVIQEQIINPHYNTCISFLRNMDMCWLGASICVHDFRWRYYLNEKGIQIEYYFHIHREICWKDIDIIERRTMSTDSEERKLVMRYIFYLQKGCTEKKKRKKTRNNFFIQCIGNELCL